MDFEKVCYWAKKAVELDTQSQQGQQEFYRLSKASGLNEMWLAYYANAYEDSWGCFWG